MRSPLVSSLKQSAGGEGISGSSSCKKPVVGLKRGPWTAEEDGLLANYVKREGEGKWRMLPKKAGLLRCGKSCRLRWMNYLRPSIKRGRISDDEEDLILRLHRLLGNRWSLIAGRIPGRTDNEIKNYWNTHLSKELINQGIDPKTHKPLLLNPMINTSNIGNKQSSDPDSSNVSNLSKKSIFVHGGADYCADHKDGTKKDEFRENDEGKSEECEEDDIDSLLMDDGFSSFLNTLINDDDNDDGIFSKSMKQHQEPEEEEKQSNC